MLLDGSRVLVAGATGVIGAAVASGLAERGARVAVAGRNPTRLAQQAAELGGVPASRIDAYDLDGCADLAAWAADRLGGLDAVVVTIGVAAFGPADTQPEPVTEHVFTVNALAPIAVLRGALAVRPTPGTLAAVTGVVAERPQRRMAAYSSAKAALSGWLTAVRAERRGQGTVVLDARLPHLDTGFADRAVAGTHPWTRPSTHCSKPWSPRPSCSPRTARAASPQTTACPNPTDLRP
ncbi:SDR family NAD(P)-dependent oxidoreductase, partial [Streptomyces alkaliterrae]|uniref:SDR family NAD(P)-dependent oxidoreductase n=1 Tax=Streptomyces alkaliterrae TaxID=2213162 RepID=UPI001E2A6F96